jgi:hypothetical protein
MNDEFGIDARRAFEEIDELRGTPPRSMVAARASVSQADGGHADVIEETNGKNTVLKVSLFADKLRPMVIRAEQMEDLAAHLEIQFEEFLRTFLRKEFPDHTQPLTDWQLSAFCRESIALCRKYGLLQYPDAAWFAAARLSIHPRFYEHPNIERALETPREEGEDAVAEILGATSPLDWQEAGRLQAHT